MMQAPFHNIPLLKEMVGETVLRLFFRVWPPEHENRLLDADISVGFTLDNKSSKVLFISTDSDNWTPKIWEAGIPNNGIFNMSYFPDRMREWMEGMIDDSNGLDYELYEAGEGKLFSCIVHQTILDVLLVQTKIDKSPFGIKVLFEKDYILSTPNSDGNTIETKKFNQFDNLQYFRKMGPIEFHSVHYLDYENE